MELVGDRLFNLPGDFQQLPALGRLGDLFDNGHVAFADREDEIRLLVREQTLDHVDQRGLAGLHLPDQEGGPRGLRLKMELLGPDVDIPQKDIIRDDIFDKSGLVVLFLIIGLGPVEGHRRHTAYRPGLGILPPGEGGIIKLGAPALKGLEGVALVADNAPLAAIDGLHNCGPVLTNAAQFVAGDHRPLRINHADGPFCAVLHL